MGILKNPTTPPPSFPQGPMFGLLVQLKGPTMGQTLLLTDQAYFKEKLFHLTSLVGPSMWVQQVHFNKIVQLLIQRQYLSLETCTYLLGKGQRVLTKNSKRLVSLFQILLHNIVYVKFLLTYRFILTKLSNCSYSTSTSLQRCVPIYWERGRERISTKSSKRLVVLVFQILLHNIVYCTVHINVQTTF